MVVESFVHHESPDVVFVIVCQAEFYLSFPVLFQLHVLLLLFCILDFSWFEIPLFGLFFLFLRFLIFLALAEEFIFLLKKLVNFLFKILFLPLIFAGINIPREFLLALIDSIHLAQVFFNLLVNVLQFIDIDHRNHWDSLLEYLAKHLGFSQSLGRWRVIGVDWSYWQARRHLFWRRRLFGSFQRLDIFLLDRDWIVFFNWNCNGR